MNKIHGLLIALLSLAGCASNTKIALGPDHPANPDAPAAPLPAASTTLAVADTPPASPPAAASGTRSNGSDGTGHDHGHGHAAHGAKPGPAGAGAAEGSTKAVYSCPHHPEVVSDQPGKCPKCKMKLSKGGEGR